MMEVNNQNETPKHKHKIVDGWIDGIFRKIHFIKYKERVLIVNKNLFVSIGRGTF